MKRVSLTAVTLLGMACGVLLLPAGDAPSRRYKALECHPVGGGGTWAILDRDGANRSVDRYLSSLGEGEMGTGLIRSPDFTLSVDRVTFTVCGHDGQGGGANGNFVALVDAAKGDVLLKTPAPGSDPMQEKSWDVKSFRGRKVRFQANDGLAAGAFAWLGVGRIDAGAELRVDFKSGLPAGWTAISPPGKESLSVVAGGIPFLDHQRTLIPQSGSAGIPCGFAARRLFFLGATVGVGKPLEERGAISIVYRDGPPERFPLVVGFTLECDFKLRSASKALHLHASGDPFLYYLVVEPRQGVIERIELQGSAQSPAQPLICGITCETDAALDALKDLPACEPGAEESSWIAAHGLSTKGPRLEDLSAEIRRANRM